MVAYLSQFMVDEEQLTLHRAEVVRQLDHKAEVSLEARRSYLLQGYLYAAGHAATPEEYTAVSERYMLETEAEKARQERIRDETLARLDAEAERVRAEKRAIPFWPYDPETEVIGDGARQQGAGTSHQRPGDADQRQLVCEPERG